MKSFLRVFFVFLLEIFEIRGAVVDKLESTTFLHDFLHSSSNITYFEPVGFDKDRVLEQHKAASRNPSDNVVIIELNAFERSFSLFLKQDINLFSQVPKVKIKSQEKEDTDNRFNFNEFYTGKIAGDQQSSVTGRIRSDGIFDGCFNTEGMLYHLEPATRYFINPLPFHSIIYQSRDVEFNSSLRIDAKIVQNIHPNLSEEPNLMSLKPSHRRTRAVRLSDNTTDANTCTLHIAADHLFYGHVGKGSVDDTIAEMIFHIASVDKIFRSTDFNGDGGPGDNIGFRIAAITVYQDTRTEGILAQTPSTTVLEYLSKWSTFDNNPYCLALLFTYQEFPAGTLGLAWVGSTENGGICSKRIRVEKSEMNFNTAVISFLNYGVRIPRKASLLTVAHELGHAFGSEHDPSEKDCSLEGPLGYYLMYAYAQDGSLYNNFRFSTCSKSQMWTIIYLKGPQCFVAQNEGIICGNRLVEEEEQCDCGMPNDCDLVDACCEPGNQSLGIPVCRVKVGYQCSPKKGPCCTQDCMYVTVPNKVCQEESQCTYESFCNYNATCPLAVSKPSNTTCNLGRNTCIDGECTGSICTAYRLQECQCSSHDHMCHVCCGNDTKGGCSSASTIAGHVILKPAGSTCNQYTGYCDHYGNCITVDTDSQLLKLKEALDRMCSRASFNNTMLWLRENWYYIVAITVGACLVTIWLKFTPCINNSSVVRIMRRIRPHQRNGQQQDRPNMSVNTAAQTEDEHLDDNYRFISTEV